MKTLKIALNFIFLMFLSSLITNSQYLNNTNVLTVPIPPLTNTGFIFFDISNINVNSPVLPDIAVLIDVQGNKEGIWNYNQGNGIFSQPIDSFYTTTNSGDSLNDIIFTQLRANSWKDVVIIVNNRLMVFLNQNGYIQNVANQTLSLNGNGINLDTGYFCTAGIHADIVVSENNGELQFFQNNYNGTLSLSYTSTIFPGLTKVRMRQMEDKYPPYIPYDASKREDVIISRNLINYQSIIQVYHNNKQNGLDPIPFFTDTLPFRTSDFEAADFNNDGYNDIIVCGCVYSDSGAPDNTWIRDIARIYKNVQGSFLNSDPVVEFNSDNGYIIGNYAKVAVADFNKDGWNDLIFTSESYGPNSTLGWTSLFINIKGDPLFNTATSDQSFFMPAPWDTPIRIKAMDIYTTGGIAFIASFAGQQPNSMGINVLNAINPDPAPPPPICQGLLENYSGNYYHPHLHLDNRGERDFDHYEIWKWKVGWDGYFKVVQYCIDTGWTDDTECVNLGGQDNPVYNCSYYAKEVDNNIPGLESQPSQTASYHVGCDPVCDNCPGGDNLLLNNNQQKDKQKSIAKLPEKFSVSNYPNPFNPSTKISYALPKPAKVVIEVYDILGRLVKELVNENKDAGFYNVIFDGTNFSSGVYFYRIHATAVGSSTLNNIQTGKMLLLK